MGKRGPRRTPTRILQIRGSTLANSRRDPDVPTGAPVCPDWIDEGAQDCWRQLVPQLEAVGLLSQIDANALARYCVAWSHWVAAEKFLKQYGTTYPIKDKDGNIKNFGHFPQVTQSSRFAEQCRRLEAEFGMTPAARSGLDTSQVSTPRNVLTEFIAGKHD